MTSEFSPPGSQAKMTKAQVRKYVQDMKNAQKIAQEKLEQAKQTGEFEKEKKELQDIENQLENL